jgi:hypothetical protein
MKKIARTASSSIGAVRGRFGADRNAFLPQHLDEFRIAGCIGFKNAVIGQQTAHLLSHQRHAAHLVLIQVIEKLGIANRAGGGPRYFCLVQIYQRHADQRCDHEDREESKAFVDWIHDSSAAPIGPSDRSTQRRPLVRRSVRDRGTTSMRQNEGRSAKMTCTMAARMTAGWVKATV